MPLKSAMTRSGRHEVLTLSLTLTACIILTEDEYIILQSRIQIHYTQIRYGFLKHEL